MRHAMSRPRLVAALGALALVLGPPAFGAADARAQTELKIAHFVTPQHSVSQWIERWARRLEEESDGQLSFSIFPGAQLGPPPKYLDIARTGQADIVWLGHGFTPGRFKLSEIAHLPFMVASAEVGAKMLNDPRVRAHLDGEHVGLRPLLLMTHQPGNIFTAETPIRTVEDMDGVRLRFASETVKDYIAALGGTPVGLPPTQIVESMQKGTIDGAFIDYGGAATAFNMGPVTKYGTEMYTYVITFCICMNQDSYDALPDDLRALIDESFVGVEAEVGHEWDKLDDIGKEIMVADGMEPIVLSDEENAKFRAIGEEVAEARIAALEEEGLPAREVYEVMRSVAEEYAATSRNFWTE